MVTIMEVWALPRCTIRATVSLTSCRHSNLIKSELDVISVESIIRMTSPCISPAWYDGPTGSISVITAPAS